MIRPHTSSSSSLSSTSEELGDIVEAFLHYVFLNSTPNPLNMYNTTQWHIQRQFSSHKNEAVREFLLVVCKVVEFSKKSYSYFQWESKKQLLLLASPRNMKCCTRSSHFSRLLQVRLVMRSVAQSSHKRLTLKLCQLAFEELEPVILQMSSWKMKNDISAFCTASVSPWTHFFRSIPCVRKYSSRFLFFFINILPCKLVFSVLSGRRATPNRMRQHHL